MASITKQKQHLRDIITARVMATYDGVSPETQRTLMARMTSLLAKHMSLQELRAWNLGMAARKEERQSGGEPS